MAATRREFEAVAEALRTRVESTREEVLRSLDRTSTASYDEANARLGEALSGVEVVANTFANLCPAFDFERFVLACGVTTTGVVERRDAQGNVVES